MLVKPSPTGVVSGPFNAIRFFSIEARLALGKSSPVFSRAVMLTYNKPGKFVRYRYFEKNLLSIHTRFMKHGAWVPIVFY